MTALKRAAGSFLTACGLIGSQAACSSTASPGAAPDAASFPAAPLQTVTTANWQIELRTMPQPPSRGTVSAELTVTRLLGGDPVDGLKLDVSPWMPAMNHGAGIVPQISPAGGGRYVVSPLELFMAGDWELRTTFSGPADGAGEINRVSPAITVR